MRLIRLLIVFIVSSLLFVNLYQFSSSLQTNGWVIHTYHSDALISGSAIELGDPLYSVEDNWLVMDSVAYQNEENSSDVFTLAYHEDDSCYGTWSYSFEVIDGIEDGFAFCASSVDNNLNPEDYDFNHMNLTGYFIYIDSAEGMTSGRDYTIIFGRLAPYYSLPYWINNKYLAFEYLSINETLFTKNSMHEIRIERPENNITVFLDNEQLFTHRTDTYTSGTHLALWSTGGHTKYHLMRSNKNYYNFEKSDVVNTTSNSSESKVFIPSCIMGIVLYHYRKNLRNP
ncbi:MAG: hypothetical protein INQ03_23910 [Candidatus Heimdallarchaeota archaeon]|nr:hypothetical protein [Candidatus Heimdallarchaeota archaeon]